MKAIVYTEYGPPDVLQLQEVEKPTPKDNQVLIKIHAASINKGDWYALTGKPFMARIGGLLKPKHKILGNDVAGRIEAVGVNVKQFQPGDDVFGDIYWCGMGAFAEYVSVPENVLRPKPASMTFEEAAAIPTAAALALHNLRGKRPIQPGQKVLINGAGGSVGTFAVQLAKYFGAEVTGVDSTKKLDMLRSIGADHVIDYTQEDFTKNGQHYDLILDVVAHRSFFDYKRALSPKGIVVFVGGSMTRVFLNMLLGPKKMGVVIWKPNKEDFVFLKELLEAGKVVPVIDRRYPLSDVAETIRYLEEDRNNCMRRWINIFGDGH